MATWEELDAELTLWADAGEVPTFWWRDDDTQGPSDDLDRLIGLAERFDVPLHLAVVPAEIDPGLKPRLEASPSVFALQHGFAHKNGEPKGLRASEMGEGRDLAATEADLREGWRRLVAAELPNLLAVQVPPWNRIGEKVVPHLPEWGYVGLSNFDVRPAPEPAAGLKQFNAHIDPIRWKEGAQFAGTEKTLQQCLEHLQMRRIGAADKDEPTGFCTHHLQTDDATWDFSEALMARLTHGQRTRWLDLRAMLKG
ncbi:polysaccharide deacetylase family protein [Sulfitobacter aestuariivivens]|uniref:Polysaccharide deacetylase family protein n=1 Tax=Sulfitobacter aestuariivivens TaxID=2766981 RepID=A0A927D6N0_9RHOB|nr:polysaccharide deacetylase family protein [Sulfitobacter aestuariivivens]MBD3665899.1 polysaccharide deacetylase family protein [Sulfitobacter aestuariivivens]